MMVGVLGGKRRQLRRQGLWPRPEAGACPCLLACLECRPDLLVQSAQLPAVKDLRKDCGCCCSWKCLIPEACRTGIQNCCWSASILCLGWHMAWHCNSTSDSICDSICDSMCDGSCDSTCDSMCDSMCDSSSDNTGNSIHGGTCDST